MLWQAEEAQSSSLSQEDGTTATVTFSRSMEGCGGRKPQPLLRGPANDHPAWDLNATCPGFCACPPTTDPHAPPLGLEEDVPEATPPIQPFLPITSSIIQGPSLSMGSWAAACGRRVPGAWGCLGGRVGGPHTVRDLGRPLRADCVPSPWEASESLT